MPPTTGCAAVSWPMRAAELDLVVVGEVLAAQEQHLPGHERLAQGRDLLVTGSADVEPDHLRAEGRAQRVQGQE
ncbi:MAG TPA: hypothetical protein VER39_01700 [Nocardioidaceae bacterium]|nr:hypothetical protein [Nocardioidaceae bacterium]